MGCFHLPEDHALLHLDRDDQVLGVDAGMIALVDESTVDDFLRVAAALIDGRESLGPPDFGHYTGGFLCGTGGDGGFAHTVYTRDMSALAVEVAFDHDEHDDHDRWVPAGVIPVPSGTLLIGDPSYLTQYVSDPFVPPVAALSAWTLLALPGPRWMALHVAKHHGHIDNRNTALRADWVASTCTNPNEP